MGNSVGMLHTPVKHMSILLRPICAITCHTCGIRIARQSSSPNLASLSRMKPHCHWHTSIYHSEPRSNPLQYITQQFHAHTSISSAENLESQIRLMLAWCQRSLSRTHTRSKLFCKMSSNDLPSGITCIEGMYGSKVQAAGASQKL